MNFNLKYGGKNIKTLTSQWNPLHHKPSLFCWKTELSFTDTAFPGAPLFTKKWRTDDPAHTTYQKGTSHGYK